MPLLPRLTAGLQEAPCVSTGGRFVILPAAAPINIPLSPKTEANYFRFIETALAEGAY